MNLASLLKRTAGADVVRYLDTSPRSYEVRRLIRHGINDLLSGLHDCNRYQRIVIVAHSLGTYIAYDAISHLWGQMNTGYPRDPVGDGKPEGLDQLENAASALPADRDGFARAQRDLWSGIRRQGNGWLITDFIGLGSPMYFADILYTRNRTVFDDRVQIREMPTCPPMPEIAKLNNERKTRLWFTYPQDGRRVLYHAAPFAVTRWTNIWFPPRWGIFGDWFGGPVAPTFGAGIADRPVPCKAVGMGPRIRPRSLLEATVQRRPGGGGAAQGDGSGLDRVASGQLANRFSGRHRGRLGEVAEAD